MSLQSLHATAPRAKNIQPAYIRGFIRDFSYWDPAGYTETNTELKGIPFCSLNLLQTGSNHNWVNGVVFEVDELDYHELIRREDGQPPLKITAYHYATDKPIGDVELFTDLIPNGHFAKHNPAQDRYLGIALAAAHQLSQNFYQDFLNSTFVDDKTLSELPDLVKEGWAGLGGVKI